MSNSRYIIATGLSQKPYEMPIFYYRLRDHAAFLKLLDIEFASVEPRMTRDFLIRFTCDAEREKAIEKLSKLTIGDIPLFGQLDKHPKNYL